MKVWKLVLTLLISGGLFAGVMHLSEQNNFRSKFVATRIKNIDDFIDLFPRNALDINERTALYLKAAQKNLHEILAIESNSRNFANTVQALDRAMGLSDMAIWGNILGLTEQVHPDASIREAAHEAIKQIQTFIIEQITGNKKVLEALTDYEKIKSFKDAPDPIKEYALQEFLDLCFRSGLYLPDEKLEQIRTLKKEIDELSLTFERNISADNQRLEVNREDLAGLDSQWIDNLERTPAGNYYLGTDYPTYFMVMENCRVEKTRKNLFFLFNNRAYPANKVILEKLIAKRHELATLIGFKSFAHFDLDDQMAQTPEAVETFLKELIEKSAPKEKIELLAWTSELPEGITRNNEGKINSWDAAFVKNSYKKKKFMIDELEIMNYFSMDKTINGLLDIYKKFMSLSFEEIPCENTWHPEVCALKVYNSDQTKLYGYLFLDLHPRPNKYSHAAHFTLLPGIYCIEAGMQIPGISCVVANFPRAQTDKPALWRRDDVKTFFHEFGHALHALLGVTTLSTTAGTNVKSDFVEMPSQMLEEWLWDADILRGLSNHYQTGKPLSDEIIEKIIALKQFDSGNMIQRQAYLALLSLKLFSENTVDIDILDQQLYETYRSLYTYEPDAHFWASFGHLANGTYGSKYYGYLWSKVFALDLFNKIYTSGGLLNPEIGNIYIQEVIGKGGSQHPTDLLENFLERKPNQLAFLATLGL